MASAMMVTEDEALELLAFLITAARTRLDEAAEYGPLRLLTAAVGKRRLVGQEGARCGIRPAENQQQQPSARYAFSVVGEAIEKDQGADEKNLFNP